MAWRRRGVQDAPGLQLMKLTRNGKYDIINLSAIPCFTYTSMNCLNILYVKFTFTDKFSQSPKVQTI